ncbi:hypothetical protein [Promicromonospora iranensis]|uniref:FtsH-binding integral membrane protein n=1 Tax=Promicromonospora iranensis TaxID=1105144 RepID=A0ABU2CTP1_9MICO|nr:hypothetical protein [Promicromonospora iranensis]MDR7384512.1 FtsH-binding integral membrane protein [Promicromonospora iranensis]
MTNEEPRASAPEIVAGLHGTLSARARLRAVAILVVGLAGAVFLAALWWTEPGPLPVLTRVAFGLMMVFCLIWAVYGIWLLRSRVPLFATDRVVAAWIGLAASALTSSLLVVMTVQRGSGAWAVIVVATALVAVAAVLVVRAHRHRAALLRREHALTGGDPELLE